MKSLIVRHDENYGEIGQAAKHLFETTTLLKIRSEMEFNGCVIYVEPTDTSTQPCTDRYWDYARKATTKAEERRRFCEYCGQERRS